MDLVALQAFVKVVQTGSFTRAADALQTQKARLSRVVSQLERELSVRLLERSTRALSLTEAGREFFERAQAILASVDDVRQAMQRIQGEPQGRLRLTCGVEFGLVAVGGWIADYLAAYPRVQVEADYSNRVVDIVHEGYDLAVRVGPLPDSSLAARRLGALGYGLYASADYLRRHAPPAGPQELPGHPLVVYDGAAPQGQWQLGRGDEVLRLKLQPRLRVNTSLAAREALQRGLGIGLLPRRVAEPPGQPPLLQRVLPGWAPPDVPVHAVFASARYLAPKVRAFIDLAVASCSPDA
ncbi:LysR family transcriptional regulator [Piscinibacter sakaiensis]|uniref:Transcriptional regulator, LysR family n=1 Tax=Piscinibacter sakaiensis TaxID=1547922 RepID=A0A0K8P7F2_PISS1|nr:LysR family transcriptional regulator [Piscinibacter sakaiensis]GAP38557.1 transcriptional regulator, LysR family [Piscinibacter sakaiensis]